MKEAEPFYTEMAEKLCAHGDAKIVLAKVLESVYGIKLSPKHYGKISPAGGKGKDGLSFTPDPNQTRIFVSLGKRDGMHPRDIADFFSNLLHIPGSKVDRIDMAREFSLVSLPKESAKKALEMAEANHNLPHMHIDVKEGGGDGGSRRRRGGRRERPVLDEEKPKSGERKRGGKRDDDRKRDKGKKSRPQKSDSKSARKPQHGEQKRNGKNAGNASLYKKSKGKAERF